MTSLDRNSITPEALRNEATRLRAELTETIDQIRQQPGYETFLTLPTYEDVQKAVTPDRPLVYLLTTTAGSLALVVTANNGQSDIHPIWLNDFTETQLNELLKVWFAAYNNSRNDHQTWLNTIDQATQQLWEPLIGPMVQQMQDLGFDRITLIPTGYLSLLPLHAAWIEDPSKPTGRRYALDHLHITYAPNAKSLTAAKEIADRVQANSILAIDNPNQNLPSSEQEVQAAIATFQNPTVIRHDQATVEQVRSQLPNVAIAHFSCHGKAELTDPLTSGLDMSDGRLTLKDIFALNLAEGDRGLRLAILSACETGLIGTENADEAISLPTGLLQAGVAAVVASLWSVSDLSTMLLLSKFYDLWRKDGLEPSQALRQAQIWLRDSTAGEIAAYGGFFTLTPTERQYAHPFHWAAFSYTGI
ncbi:MAG: CHAT domain-containing protein [Synechococcales cyanobacterium RM1_1_8]|nr:CHAT domain-containing protein [Synechococcales cyanobacterium RM1_1_8]